MKYGQQQAHRWLAADFDSLGTLAAPNKPAERQQAQPELPHRP